MEQGENNNNGKRPLSDAGDELALVVVPEAKKQYKNPTQIQILEDAYAVTPQPSASLKEELARRTGLDYKQVQYWFGNRRYLDRHGPRKYTPRRNGDAGHGQSKPWFAQGMNMALIVASDIQLPKTGSIDNVASSLLWRKFQDEDVKILAHIEKRLGQPLTLDGPVLGKEFGTLPPGAFGFPLGDKATSFVPDIRQNFQRPSAKLIQDKMPSSSPASGLVPCTSNDRALLAPHGLDVPYLEYSPLVHEYQFFPAQPSRSEDNKEVDQTCIKVPSHHDVVSCAPCMAKPETTLHLPNKMDIHNPDACTEDKIQMLCLGSQMVDNVQPCADTTTLNTVIYEKGSTSAGPSTDYLEDGLADNGSTALWEIKDDSNQGEEAPGDEGCGPFIVRPCGRAILEDNTTRRYFADTALVPILAEWDENGSRAVYSLDNDAVYSSDSSERDSSCCIKNTKEAAGGSECFCTGKAAVLVDVSSDGDTTPKEGHEKPKADDEGTEDDEEATEDWDYKDDTSKNKDNGKDCAESMASPVSSDQTI